MDAGYRDLNKDEVIEAGDEIDRCQNPWRDYAVWQPVSPDDIGNAAPDPQYVAHRIYRRKIKENENE